jgi:hypothetical protein
VGRVLAVSRSDPQERCYSEGRRSSPFARLRRRLDRRYRNPARGRWSPSTFSAFSSDPNCRATAPVARSRQAKRSPYTFRGHPSTVIDRRYSNAAVPPSACSLFPEALHRSAATAEIEGHPPSLDQDRAPGLLRLHESVAAKARAATDVTAAKALALFFLPLHFSGAFQFYE